MELKPRFRDPEKVSLSSDRGVTSIKVTNTKIMQTFFLDQILCPLKRSVPKERFHCTQKGSLLVQMLWNNINVHYRFNFGIYLHNFIHDQACYNLRKGFMKGFYAFFPLYLVSYHTIQPS